MTEAEVGAVCFGSEGQRWEMMRVAAFVAHDRAVPVLRDRLAEFLDALT